MTDFRKGDVCSLEVVVQAVLEDRAVVGIAGCDDPYAVPQDYLTLIRRAPVDLATCEIPEEGVPVRGGSGEASPSVMVARHGKMAWLKWPGGDYTSALVQYLRPLDAHAPSDGKGCYLSDLDYYIRQCGDASETAVSVQRLREWRDSFNALYYGPRPDWAPNIDAPAPKGEVERLRARIAEVLTTLGTKYHATAVTKLMDELAGTVPTYTLDAPAPDKGEVERLRAALEGIRQYGLDTMSGRVDGPDDRAWQRAAVVEMTKRARLALNPDDTSTAPTCPPGHIMIGDRAVPEPMREAPDVGTFIYSANPGSPGLVGTRRWANDFIDRHQLMSGFIYPGTNEGHRAAIARAEAIIALSAGEGV